MVYVKSATLKGTFIYYVDPW